MGSSPSYLDPIILARVVGDTVLDVGCGLGRWGSLIESNFWEAGLTKPPQVDGFDAFLPNVEFSSKKSCYRTVWHQVMPSPLKGKWDTVLACEVLEHIDQEHILEVISSLESATSKRIIFSTPNWPNYRNGHDTVCGFNDREAHRSYISRDFFRRRGYQLIGANFGNPEQLFVRAANKLRLSWAFHTLPRLFPSLGETLVAFKDIK